MLISGMEGGIRVAGTPGAGTRARAAGHAGEILQGAVREGGRVHRFLCTLPAPPLESTATVAPTPGRPLEVHPGWARKSLAAARLLAARAGIEVPEVEIRLASSIPVAKGCGSSTADVVATLRALLAYLRRTLPDEEVARLAVEAEGSSDGSMLPFPAVFRQREGVASEILSGAIPAMRVMVVDTQPEVTLDTLEFRRARYTGRQLEAFAALLDELRRAFREGDAAGVGAVATASARINQAYLPKPRLEEWIAAAAREGGYGVGAAHSGTVLALLLPASAATGSRDRLAAHAAALGMPVLADYVFHARGGNAIPLSAPGPLNVCYPGRGAPQGAEQGKRCDSVAVPPL